MHQEIKDGDSLVKRFRGRLVRYWPQRRRYVTWWIVSSARLLSLGLCQETMTNVIATMDIRNFKIFCVVQGGLT